MIGRNKRRIATINPVDNKLVKEFKELSDRELDRKLTFAEDSYHSFRTVMLSVRKKGIRTLGELMLTDKENLARLITLEMGKPISQALGEIEKCATLCEYYADHAKTMLADKVIETDASQSYVSFEPLGVVLAVMPWNYPFWQVIRCAVPAIIAGNVVLLKHAPNVPQCALALEELFNRALSQDGAFQNLFISEKKVGHVLEHPSVKHVSLTGSEKAGSSVAAIAGKNIKRSVLELGGSDPFIVLEDANLKMAAQEGTYARFQNAGQSCIAAKRFIVAKSHEKQFVEMMREQVEQFKVGDPINDDTDIGPLARPDLAMAAYIQMKGSIKKGAKLVLGGVRPDKGSFLQPSIISGVKPGMPTFEQEVFGPVASIVCVKDDDEAIKLANQTSYGLGASIWTTDLDKAQRLSKRVNSGQVYINSMVRSDPRLPFGGINKSGYGRELSSFGLKEFVNAKTIYIS